MWKVLPTASTQQTDVHRTYKCTFPVSQGFAFPSARPITTTVISLKKTNLLWLVTHYNSQVFTKTFSWAIVMSRIKFKLDEAVPQYRYTIMNNVIICFYVFKSTKNLQANAAINEVTQYENTFLYLKRYFV